MRLCPGLRRKDTTAAAPPPARPAAPPSCARRDPAPLRSPRPRPAARAASNSGEMGCSALWSAPPVLRAQRSLPEDTPTTRLTRIETRAWGLQEFSSVQSLSRVQLFETPWTAARQASLSITNSQSLLKLMSIELVMPSNHLICRPLLLPSIFPSIMVFSGLCPQPPVHWWAGEKENEKGVNRPSLEMPYIPCPQTIIWSSVLQLHLT
ncbi:uncharacterized protein LOC133254254 isoform X2 [Bos javanicus]|nr:uncharacterized protein LOC133254254 isoform X2 [Bos javanicus]